MPINRDDVNKLARLARLRLSEEEKAEAEVSLNAVLAMIDTLREADVDKVDAMAHVQGRGQTLRCRAPAAAPGFPRSALLANAPKEEDGHFLTPKVVE